MNAALVSSQMRVVAWIAGTLALVCAMASPALAGGLCVQVDSGANAGSLIVLKKVKVGARAVGPAQGFFAQWSGSEYGFFFPVEGQAINNSARDLAVGLTYHRPGFNAAGSLGGGGPSIEIAIRCVAGPDEKVNVLDACGFSFDGSLGGGHVVECSAAPALP